MSHRNTRARNELEQMRLPDLQTRFREVTGETSRSPNRKFLIRRIEEVLAARDTAAPARAEETDDRESAPEATAQGSADEDADEPPADGTLDATDDADATEDADVSEDADEALEESATVALATESNEAAALASETARRRQPRGRFASMTIEELQTKYLDVVGRATGSDDRRYLIWKIREAEKGRINVGPRRTRERDGEPLDVKILPLRLEADAAEKMDEAWRARGIKSRMEFFRGAIGHYLAHLGAPDAAALFGRNAPSDA
jgi:hypothetical protein